LRAIGRRGDFRAGFSDYDAKKCLTGQGKNGHFPHQNFVPREECMEGVGVLGINAFDGALRKKESPLPKICKL
jgi:hypothetical protein